MYFCDISNRKNNTWCKYVLRLDTYGCGCQHDCKYCYAKSLLDFRGLWNSSSPKISNLIDIKLKLSTLKKSSIVKLGGMTDCFMPLELKHRVTFETIKMLNYYKIHYLIVTKSSIVSNDEYLNIYDKNLAHFQISITSTSKEISLKYENASLPNERIKSIEKLYSLGFDTCVRLSPFVDEHIDVDTINNIKCNKILIEFLKVNHWVKKWFDIDYSKYTLNIAGYLNLELKDKINIIKKINNFEQISIGEYVKEHHDYFSRNINYNINDCCNLNYKFRNVVNYKQLSLF